MLWGGDRLRTFLGRPSSSDDPVGEAWLVSDEGANASRVADGPLAGKSLRELLAAMPERLLGRSASVDGRFPVLLKFIDARQALSVQVHPNDEQAQRMNGAGARGKTEAWVILDAQEDSRIYSGLRAGVTERDFRRALDEGRVAETLHSFRPNPGDCVFLRAGTVHAIGQNVLLFEIQQTSDVTYRLYDWDRVDAKTGKPRELHLDEGLACTNFAAGPCDPVAPVVESRGGAPVERLATCEYFSLWRHRGRSPFAVGAPEHCRIVVGVVGEVTLRRNGQEHAVRPGDVLLLPAAAGSWDCVPRGGEVTVLECGLPAP
jgi:mannose-6-phosphate isomerase